MIPFLVWYLAVSLVGLATFPLAYRLFPALPDRGYALSRALGWLLWGYLFWLLGSLGILGNDLGGQLFALVLLLVLSGLSLRQTGLQGLADWFRSQRALVIGVEAVFLLAFAFLTVVRAANAEIIGTEKPMELAFINAVLRSPSFPPHDPWLSGYAISYYHFGYILVAMLARLSGVSGGVGFNLGLALVFALSAVGVYGIVYDLLAARHSSHSNRHSPLASRHSLLAVLGPVFLLLVSNLEGILELLHNYGILGNTSPDKGNVSSFWTWLDIRDLREPSLSAFQWPPRYLWWWRASRVLSDYDFARNWREIIDEFPAFSYVLGDLHPHVLAMPFAFLGMALALNWMLGGGRGLLRIPKLRLDLHLDAEGLLFAALVLGGMAFLNFWDFPIYVVLFLGAYVLVRARQAGWGWGRLVDFVSLGLAVGIPSVALYLPFYLGFSSQAGGFVPNLIYITRGAHLWVMFGSLFVPIFAYLAYLRASNPDLKGLWKGVWLALGVVLVLWASVLVFAYLIRFIPLLVRINPQAAIAPQAYLGELHAGDWGSLYVESFRRRLVDIGGWGTIVVLLSLTLGLLVKRGKDESESDDISTPDRDEPVGSATRQVRPAIVQTAHSPLVTGYALLLILVGAVLVLTPEFYYLRDQFGWRMNTIFKFYFQAWILWSAAAAFGSAVLLQELRNPWRAVLAAGLVALLGGTLVYPALGFWDRTSGFNPPQGWNLDGGAYMETYAPDELAAIQWLKQAPDGVLVEAVRPDGGSYSDFARVSVYSGLPTVLGWVGHESQWRGGYEEMGSRQDDIARLYNTRNWDEARGILEHYNIRYVVVGPRERSTYSVFEVKFERFLEQVFQQGEMTIYEVP
jgi:uncharacterized membrane protein